jgi:large subunit ribosomal protein L13
MLKTFSAKKEEVKRDWLLVNASGETLGRLASKVAMILRGKHKPIYTPHVDTGDFVVIINAEKINLTGKKIENKRYYHHTGYPGGIKSITVKDMLKKEPKNVIKFAVKGMLPKNPLGRMMIKKLKVYSGEEHPHQAQKPKQIKISEK